MRKLLVVTPDIWNVPPQLTPPPGVGLIAGESAAALPPDLSGVEAAIVLPGMFDAAIASRMPDLKWVQTMTAGIDEVTGIVAPDVVISNARGVHAPQVTELIFLFMLGLQRNIRGVLAAQAERRWARAAQPVLVGRHVVIAGLGAIAEMLAERCRLFGMRVSGVSDSRSEAPGFESIRPYAALAEAAAEADFLVLLAPLTDRTRGLVDAQVLRAMKPEAFLINAGRGPVVDEAALIDALIERRIAGAGLDVFTEEPLSAASPLWALENVMLTPHVGGWSTNLVEQAAPLLNENMARWFGSPQRPLINEMRR